MSSQAKSSKAAQAIDSILSTLNSVVHGTPVLVSEEVTKGRLKVCSACDKKEDSSLGMKCVECGCFVEFKSKFANMSCPAKKWSE